MQLPRSTREVLITEDPAEAMKGLLQALPDIRRFISRARGPVGPDNRPPFKFNLNPTVAAFRAYIASAPASHAIAIDIETPRHRPFDIKLIGVSVSPWSAMVVPGEPEFIDVIADVLADRARLKIGHNFAYDLRAFLAAGCEVEDPIADTIQGEALLRPPFKEAKRRRWLALSNCVLRRFAIPYWKEVDSITMPQQKSLYKAWFPDVPAWRFDRQYCALDVSLTWMLHRQQEQEMIDGGSFKLYRDIICPAALKFILMEDYGVPVDVERLQAKLKFTKRKLARFEKIIDGYVAEKHAMRLSLAQNKIATLEAARDAIVKIVVKKGQSIAKPDVRNPARKALTPVIAKVRQKLDQIGPKFESGNDNHWRAIFFGAPEEGGLGLRPTRLTGKLGLGGVDEDDIIELQSIYPKQLLLKARVKTTHLHRRKEWLESLKPDHNNRLHVPWTMSRTENGRVASGLDNAEPDKVRESDGGQLMNVPEADRDIFVAEPGMTWIEHDLSQVELRVMAWLAKDMDLLRELRDGKDVHCINAHAIFGIPECEGGCNKKTCPMTTHMVYFEGQWRPARTACKRPTHGWDYGLMDEKCGGMFRPSEQDSLPTVLAFLAEVFKRTSGVEGMQESSWNRRVRQTQKSTNPEAEYGKLVRRIYDEANTLRAKGWRVAYFKRRAGLARFQQDVVNTVEKHWQLTNPYGRTLTFPNKRWDYKMQRWAIGDREEALAFLPASTVGDEAKAMIPAMYDCARKHGGRLLIFNHDAFSSQIPHANVEAYKKEAKEIMEREWRQLGRIEEFGWFRCPAESKQGPSWGEAK